MEKKSLKELVDELERQKTSRYDVVVPSENLIVLKDGDNLYVDVPQPDGTSKRHGITEYAHSQFADKTGIPLKYYNKMKETGHIDLLATNINEWLPTKDKRLVRILDNNVRALLSDRYRIIDNYDVVYATLEEFKKIQEQRNINIEIKRNDLTETSLYIKATSPDLTDEVIHWKDRDGNEKTEPVHGGIIISNSEVGAGAFNVKPFVNVLVCQNGLIGEHVFKRVHIGRELGVGLIDWSNETLELEDAALWSKIRDMIQATFDSEVFHKWMDEINEVASTEVPKPVIAVDNIIKHFDMPKSKKDDLLNQFAKESPTQWGLSMAVTQIAQNEEDYEQQIEMEKIGAKILDKKITPIILKED